mmetsp:Transcript_36973/g.94537  ORF Transcript_36973/g.94537 Transcript_36973/m.94537 type:complete len:104 (+) Transcript_36973:125-436(+)|eukprot:jgi/Tetstr1/448076/TSEL_035375.t1
MAPATGLARWLIPEALPLGLAVGTGLSMMVYTMGRSFYSMGDVTVSKADRENLRTSEEYDVNTEWGVKNHNKGILRQAGQWWGSSNVLPNEYMAKFFREQQEH